MSLSIKFIGATETVTGSCYLVTWNDTKFIVDCGMYQGPEVEARNLEPFPFDPAEVDFVLLTHTHIDHSGLLPKLVKHNFTGQIYATFHTIQLATILLLDSAKIQESNFKEGIPWKHAGKVAMAYSTRDAEEAIARLSKVDFEEEFSPVPGLTFKYVRAGHVLGAASILMTVDDKKVVFSGDIGRVKQDLIPGFDLEAKWDPDYILMESLYGGQIHPNRAESVDELVKIIRDVTGKGGSVFIPSFAVQRTQEILNDLKLAKQAGALPRELGVILDSPMAQKVTNIYADALDNTEESNFDFPGLRFIRNYRESMKASKKGGQVVIAGSGMADGGRIMSHIAANAGNPKNAICFVGYQAETTLGRELVEGSKDILIDKAMIKVRAQVYHLQGFSAHGDTNDYIAWVSRYQSPNLKKTFLIHAEPSRAATMKQLMEEKGLDHPYIPKREEVVEL